MPEVILNRHKKNCNTRKLQKCHIKTTVLFTKFFSFDYFLQFSYWIILRSIELDPYNTYDTNIIFISNNFVCMWSPPLKCEIWLLKVSLELLQNWGDIFYGVPRTLNQEKHWQHMLILFECNDICFMDYHKRWNIKVAFSSFILHYQLNSPNPSSFSKFMFMMSWSLVSGCGVI